MIQVCPDEIADNESINVAQGMFLPTKMNAAAC